MDTGICPDCLCHWLFLFAYTALYLSSYYYFVGGGSVQEWRHERDVDDETAGRDGLREFIVDGEQRE